MARGEVDINNFFSFLAAMMLAYQPVRSLSTLNMVINQGLSAASRIIPIIDQKNEINNSENAKPLIIKKANINFNNLNFSYEITERKTLDSVNLEFEGGKMTSLVGHSGSGKSTILNLIPRFYDAQSGDIVIDNIGTTSIVNNKVTTSKILNENVTYAKIQQVSATNKILGRVSAGAGIIEEISTTGTGDVVRAISPTFTGAPQTPTPVVSSNDQTVANTEFVTRAIICPAALRTCLATK